MKNGIISIIIAFLLLIAFVIINGRMTKKAIDLCVQSGNDYYTCLKELQ